MGVSTWIDRISATRLLKRGITLIDPNKSAPWLWGLTDNPSGKPIQIDRGTAITAVFNSINTVSREVASTPIDIKQKTAQGRVTVDGDPNYRLISTRPNTKMSAYQFWYAMVCHYLGWGNAYAYIWESPDGRQLLPLMPWDVEVTQDFSGIYYKYAGHVIMSRDILHFRLYTKDGGVGISPILYNSELLNHRLNITDYANNAIGKKPTGFMSGEMSDPQMDQIVKTWTERQRNGQIPYLNGSNIKWNPQLIPPNEGQMLETMRYSDQQVYAMYNLPPTFVQDYSQGIKADAEQQSINLVKHCLMPHYVMIEQELNEKLFPERNKLLSNPKYIKFNVNGKLRGDMATRYKVYHDMILDGVFNADVVLELEDMPKQPNGLGQIYMVQGAMIEKGKTPDPTEPPPPTETKARIEIPPRDDKRNGHAILNEN